jgi:alkylhydroperoxidase/carboxymuconolactone decarboxylase family protein YurZ
MTATRHGADMSPAAGCMRRTRGSELDEPMPNPDVPDASIGIGPPPPARDREATGEALGDPPAEPPPVREELLRRIALGEVELVPDVAGGSDGLAPGLPDQRTRALARLGALLAADPVGPPLRQTVADALAASVTRDEVVGVLVSLIPTIGVARAAAVAPELGLAIGYDVGAALELSIPARPAR